MSIKTRLYESNSKRRGGGAGVTGWIALGCKYVWEVVKEENVGFVDAGSLFSGP